MSGMAESDPRAGREGGPGRWRQARYAAAQGLRVGWYALHYAALQRMRRGAADAKAPPVASSAPNPDRARLREALIELFRQDLGAIEAGLYPAPRDFDARKLAKALRDSRRFLADAKLVDARRRRRGGMEVRTRADRGRFPAYYVQNFHYQTDGWLSRRSARLYDTQVEVLFTGAADAMRRAVLAKVAAELRGRDQRAVSLLDVACGPGRFLEQTLDAFPRLRVTGIDLSPDYVGEAADRLRPWPQARAAEANAEAIPFDRAAFDIVASIYLLHELPPRVRPIVAAEIARVTRPGGLVVIADSIQSGDEPHLDGLLAAFPHHLHEPYYASYCAEDLDVLFAAAGLQPESETMAFLTKVKTYRKPVDQPSPAAP